MRTVLLALLVVGCGDNHPSYSTVVDVWHDDERGVTCLVVVEQRSCVSVTCLPDAVLAAKLARDDLCRR
ncbi:hypothetical protein D7Y15_23215 [Corallococcus sp. AB030]|nr:hypothetical protein D7Y15_23215 [Corallococcus sp. AB030]